MDRRTARVRLLVGLGPALAAALVIFVLAPWLTPPAPPDSAEKMVEPALASSGEANGETGAEAVVQEGEVPLSVSLLPAEVEHPVMGAAVGMPVPESETSDMEAPAGELPELLPPAEVAAAMSEPVRVASAPDVEMGDGQGSADEPSVKAENSPVQESVAAEPTPGETVEVTKPVVVETVAPEVLEVSKQVSVEPETLETAEVQKSSGSGVPRGGIRDAARKGPPRRAGRDRDYRVALRGGRPCSCGRDVGGCA